MLTAAVAFSSRALCTSDRCPSWSAPIVGTRPKGLATSLWAAVISATVWMSLIGLAHLGEQLRQDFFFEVVAVIGAGEALLSHLCRVLP